MVPRASATLRRTHSSGSSRNAHRAAAASAPARAPMSPSAYAANPRTWARSSLRAAIKAATASSPTTPSEYAACSRTYSRSSSRAASNGPTAAAPTAPSEYAALRRTGSASSPSALSSSSRAGAAFSPNAPRASVAAKRCSNVPLRDALGCSTGPLASARIGAPACQSHIRDHTTRCLVEGAEPLAGHPGAWMFQLGRLGSLRRVN